MLILTVLFCFLIKSLSLSSTLDAHFFRYFLYSSLPSSSSNKNDDFRLFFDLKSPLHGLFLLFLFKCVFHKDLILFHVFLWFCHPMQSYFVFRFVMHWLFSDIVAVFVWFILTEQLQSITDTRMTWVPML